MSNNILMKTVKQHSLLVFFFLGVSLVSQAQSGGGGSIPVVPGTNEVETSGQRRVVIPPGYVLYKGYVVPRSVVEAQGGSPGRPVTTLPGYTNYKGYLVPIAVVEAQQRTGGRPPSGPQSEEEKRRIMVEHINKFKALAQARKERGG